MRRSEGELIFCHTACRERGVVTETHVCCVSDVCSVGKEIEEIEWAVEAVDSG